MDKNSTANRDELKSASEPLERSLVKIVPVAIGNAADSKTLIAITSNPANLLELKKSESPTSIGREIMNKVSTGKNQTLIVGLK